MADLITLLVTYQNLDNEPKKFSYDTTKACLIERSEYFGIMLQKFKEAEEKEISLIIPDYIKCDKKHLEILFDIGIGKQYQKYEPVFKSYISIRYVTNSSESINEDIFLQTNYGLGVPISEYHIILSLAQYFNLQHLLVFIKDHLRRYKQLLNDVKYDRVKPPAHKTDLEDDVDEEPEPCYDEEPDEELEPCSDEDDCEEPEPCYDKPKPCNNKNNSNEPGEIMDQYKQEYDSYMFLTEEIDTTISLDRNNLTTTNIENYVQKIWIKHLVKEFLDNIYYIYQLYDTYIQTYHFLEIVNIMIYLKDKINMKTLESNITNETLTKIPFDELYKIKNKLNGKVKFIFDNINLYDLYQQLAYDESGDFVTFTIKNYNKTINSTRGHPAIKTREEFDKLWKLETGKIFDGFNWKNVILSGGFLYGLLSSSQQPISCSSDIDLFIYTDGLFEYNEDVMERCCEFFSKFNPQWIKRGDVVTIIIPDFKYDIQLIPTSKQTPLEIIQDFDFNYVQMYYNGEDIWCTFEALVGLKYNLAIYNQEDIKIDRVYKAVRKGLNIVCDEKTNKLKRLNNDCIITLDFEYLENYTNTKIHLNKTSMIRKLIPHLNSEEATDLIKYYYKTNIASNSYKKLDQNTVIDSDLLDEEEEYKKFLENNQLDINNLVDLKEGYKINHMQFYNLIDTKGISKDYITLDIDDCIYKFSDDTFGMDSYYFTIQLSKVDSKKIILIEENFEKILDEKYNLDTLCEYEYDDTVSIGVRVRKDNQEALYDRITELKDRFYNKTLLKATLVIKLL